MRPSWNRDLVALILLLAVFRSPAFADKARPKPVPKPATVVKTFEETAYGVNADLARRLALEKLVVDVNAWLLAEHPEIGYRPTRDDIEGMDRSYSEPRPYERKKDADLPELDDNPQVVVTLKAVLKSTDLSGYEANARNQLSQHRQALLARGLTGAVALLAVGTGYFKLEEKVGRHKKKLGAAAVSVLGLVGLALLAWGFNYF
jgi:hypothetical protein